MARQIDINSIIHYTGCSCWTLEASWWTFEPMAQQLGLAWEKIFEDRREFWVIIMSVWVHMICICMLYVILINLTVFTRQCPPYTRSVPWWNEGEPWVDICVVLHFPLLPSSFSNDIIMTPYHIANMISLLHPLHYDLILLTMLPYYIIMIWYHTTMTLSPLCMYSVTI